MIKSKMKKNNECKVELKGLSENILTEYGVLSEAIFTRFVDYPDLLFALISKAAINAGLSGLLHIGKDL